MKFRWQRGGLDDSMSTVVEFETMDDLINILSSVIDDLSDVTVKPYTYDDRINWNTYIVLVNGSPAGFTNGPVE